MRRRCRFIVLLVLAVGGLAPPAFAHDARRIDGDTEDGCQTSQLYDSDPECRGHWRNSHMYYHWGNEIDDNHHAGHRERFHDAVRHGWVERSNPDSPWHKHKNSSAGTHVDMQNSSGPRLGRGLVAQDDSNAHIPRVLELWLRHDIADLQLPDGTDLSWYRGTGDVPNDQVDAWSAWAEEVGHAQNITHFTPSGADACHVTMSGTTCVGERKRSPSSHEIWHACVAYRRVHNSC